MKNKKLVSILAGIMILSAVATGCSSKDANASAEGYKDGSYTAEVEGQSGPMNVEVEIKDGKIAEVKVASHNETDGIATPALEQLPAAIVEKNSTEVESVSGATLTSGRIIEAVNACLEQAK